jgi:hypothetical protein
MPSDRSWVSIPTQDNLKNPSPLFLQPLQMWAWCVPRDAPRGWIENILGGISGTANQSLPACQLASQVSKAKRRWKAPSHVSPLVKLEGMRLGRGGQLCISFYFPGKLGPAWPLLAPTTDVFLKCFLDVSFHLCTSWQGSQQMFRYADRRTDDGNSLELL